MPKPEPIKRIINNYHNTFWDINYVSKQIEQIGFYRNLKREKIYKKLYE